MPTGYTSDLYEGKEQSFEEFALKCAHAFGALIELRDMGLDAEIPDTFEVSDWHERSVQDAIAKLVELQKLTPDGWEERQRAEVSKANEAMEQARVRSAALRVRYETMLAAVEQWTPPTSEHVGLRDFMVQQLTESIRFDCSSSFLEPLEMVPTAEYVSEQLERAGKALERARRSLTDEQRRVEGRNAWVRALRRSLQVAA